MTSPDQERWLRVKEKLRAEVGEDIFQSWFARMDLERIEVNTAHLSVPTRKDTSPTNLQHPPLKRSNRA